MQGTIIEILHHTYYFPGTTIIVRQSCAWSFDQVKPQSLQKGFVDEHGPYGIRRIVAGKISAFQERYLHQRQKGLVDRTDDKANWLGGAGPRTAIAPRSGTRGE